MRKRRRHELEHTRDFRFPLLSSRTKRSSKNCAGEAFFAFGTVSERKSRMTLISRSEIVRSRRQIVNPEENGDVVRGAHGQDGDRRVFTAQAFGELPDDPIAAGYRDQIHRFARRLIPAGFLAGVTRRLVSSAVNKLHQVAG